MRQTLSLVVVAVLVGLLGGQAGPASAAPGLAQRCARILDAGANGSRAVALLGSRLADVAARHRQGAGTLRDRLLSDHTLWVDRCGRLFYVDPASAEEPVGAAQEALPQAAPAGGAFLLHSRPGASRVIYLDFEGELITGTAWNDSDNGGNDFLAAPYDSDGSATFSAAEEAFVQDVWSRVAEDYSPFDVDVTTQDPGFDAIHRSGFGDTVFGTRVLITHGGPISATCSCGGIAYVGVFDYPPDHAYYQPAFVFAENWSTAKFTAEASSHEAGHNLGLNHDATSTTGYYPGHGSWAPIMGVGYYRPTVQWSRGEYTGATNGEDDLAVMQIFGAPLRLDDHPDSRLSAAALGNGANLEAAGRIGTRADVDWFSFEGAGPTTLSVTSTAMSPNLDARLDLYDAAGIPIASADPPSATVSAEIASGLDAAISLTLPAPGTYFIRIDGVGFASPSSTGYSDYASLGQYTLSVATTDPDSPPTIAGLTPASGAPGTSVTIAGANFTGTTGVAFNGLPATFTVNSAAQVTATVPAGATSGPVTLTTGNGTATSATAFTVLALPAAPAPTVSGFSPTSSVIGSSVAVSGANFAGASGVTFNGVAASFTVSSASSLTAIVPPGATSGPIRVTTASGTGSSSGTFSIRPNITGFTPASGGAGATVTINGTGFSGVTSVKFNAVSSTYVVDSPTQITAAVPANATSGAITVTAAGSTATSPTAFTVAPRITSLSPSGGLIGSSVTINGANFTGASAVRFNGVLAAFTPSSASKVTTTVPAGATTGLVTVTTPAGTASSPAAYTVNFTPTISGFTPTSGASGVVVTISGTNFSGASSVRFNGTSGSFTVTGPTQITTTVPTNATTGPLTVTTPGGIATSTAAFTVGPRITSLSPNSGIIGSAVVVNGANFSGVTSVTVNGLAASFTLDSQTRITATVPPGATSGRIAVTTPVGTGTSSSTFTVRPAITGFSPSSGGAPSTVTITGSGFTGATSVKFNGSTASFTVNSSTQMTATVPAAATSGSISVTTPAGNATSTGTFTVAPRITSFTPLTGSVGALVTISGANFSGATAVRFNGTSATYTVTSSTKITATVPAGATTGRISVVTSAGTATSSGTFTAT